MMIECTSLSERCSILRFVLRCQQVSGRKNVWNIKLKCKKNFHFTKCKKNLHFTKCKKNLHFIKCKK
ncbi:hypothetical protein H5410_052718 [Solanum commersonii]|uniref:Uncharacterized protein n=1 Tax=Solanum commersonii TaxID=4109 RepID=A0A9J5X1V7_SOLCO|nr:hypothetical protein H5410_052718 [Solanum commersonii]